MSHFSFSLHSMLCFPFFFFLFISPSYQNILFPSFCPCIILREHKPFKSCSTQDEFFSNFGSHVPDSSPWTPIENVDIQRTGPVIRHGSSRGVCECVCVGALIRVWLFVTPWTVTRQTPLSMEFSRQKYWSGLSFPPPEDLPDPRWNWSLLHCQAESLLLSH